MFYLIFFLLLILSLSHDCYLFISLGKLAAVQILSDKKEYCIDCSWSPPFSLDGVPIYGYIINVTNEGHNTQYTTEVSNTTSNWTYCPSQFGNYTVSIAGNNSAGEGEVNTTSVTLPTGMIVSFKIILINKLYP